MPNNIYNKLPYIEINKIKCVHPHFMLLDAYRVITDPMTSYWRLDKSIHRFQKILSYYPLDSTLKKINTIQKKYNILKFIKKNIIINSNFIIIGDYSYNYYVKKENKNNKISITNYEMITDNLVKDGIYILKLLNEKFNNNIKTKQYYPFFEYMDNKIEYYYKNSKILTLYGNNNRCIVYYYSKKKNIYFGTFNLVLMYFFFNYYLNIVNSTQANIINNFNKINNLIYIRNKYLDTKNITVIDKSPFQDFTYNCKGIPINLRRHSFLNSLNKKNEKKLIKFKYTPTGNTKKIPNYIFNNISGNQILISKKLI
jgi:hypothetical protein